MVTTQIELKRSRALLAMQLGMVILAMLGVVFAVLPIEIRVGLGLAILAILIWAKVQARKPLPKLRIRSDGQIQLRNDDGDWQSAEVLPGDFVTPGLSVVRLRAGSSVHKLVLLPDSADAEALRRLRLSLRWAPRTRSDIAYPGAG